MESKFYSIGNLFTTPRAAVFTVPEYQRGFEWGLKNFQDLWSDLDRIGDRVDRHFLGNIILLHESDAADTVEIVDGQQRMATISLLVMAIRDCGLSEEYAQVDDIINAQPQKETKRRLRLYENEADSSFEAIWNGNPEDADGAVATAYEYYMEQLESHSEDELIDLLQKITEDLKVVRTRAKDPSLAFMIFQSQNERGVEVDPEILIKARVFGEADRLDDSYSSKNLKTTWQRIYSKLEENLNPPRFGDEHCIRRPITQILINSDTPTPNIIDKSELYRRFSDALETEDSVEEFVNEFESKVDSYLEIASNDYDINYGQSDEVKRHLQYLNASSSHGEIASIAIIKNATGEREIREGLRLASVLATRMRLADYRSKDRMSALHSAAGSINNGEDIEQTLINLIQNKGPEDGEIEEYLKSNSMVVRGQWRFRTLLSLVAIEENRRATLVAGLDNLAVEHIAPQNTFGKNRRSGRDYRAWRRSIGNKQRFENENERHKLGNLTLLTKTDHNRVDETSFETKQGVYEGSGFKITEDIHSEYDTWDLEAIQKRTEDLAQELVRVWSI